MKFKLIGAIGIAFSVILAVALGISTASAATIVVEDTSDTLHSPGCAVSGMGTCSLRDAIAFANADPGPDEIHFAIAGSGVHTMTLVSDLPTVAGDLTIDGYTQSGSSPNTNGPGLGDNAVLLIEINGNGKRCLGLGGTNNTIRGLVINRCSGYGIRTFSDSSGQQVVEGNFIGTDPTGKMSQANAGGVSVEVGATVEISHNIVSGNAMQGISVTTAHVAIHGNYIGTDASGTLPLGNRLSGIRIFEDGDSPSEAVISGNTIAFNGTNDPVGGGIVYFSGSHHWYFSDPTILGNSIFDNTSDGSFTDRGLGIDLVGPGPNPNPPCNDTGEGQWAQNSPVLTAAVASGSAIRIQGGLDSTPTTSFRIEFFGSPSCDPSGYGEGKVFLGFAEVTTDESCNGSFDVTLPISASPGQYVTATATDKSTSEFSACQVVTHAPVGILSVAPTSGPAEGGTSVTVEGLGFQAGATASFGGGPAGGTVFGSSTELSTTAPSLTPGTLNDLMITNPDSSSATLPKAWMADFSDVGTSYLFHGAVERIFRAGITAGCGNGSYCPEDLVRRGEIAAFIARAMAGGGANVPASGMADGRPYDCTPGGASLFRDVSPADSFCRHVHYLAAQHVTLGCSPTAFCPTATANREDMAALIAKAIVAPGGGAAVPEGYTDPLSGRWYGCYPDSPPEFQHFTDITPADPFCKHVHFLWAKGIISGCTGEPPQYCPALTVDRGTIARFLANAFTPAIGP